MNIVIIYEDSSKEYTAIHKSFFEGLKRFGKTVLYEIPQATNSQFINKIIHRIPVCKAVYYRIINIAMVSRIGKLRPSIILVIKGNPVYPASLKTIRVKNPGVKLYNFNPDDPFNKRVTSAYAFQSIRLYDCCFIWSRRIQSQLITSGCRKSVYLPFGVDSDLIFPVDSSEYVYPVSFIGNADAERISFFKTLLKVPGIQPFHIHMFGSGWEQFKNVLNIHPQVTGIDYLRTVGKSKINLNVLRHQNKSSINMRTFEVPAAFGFMLHESSSEAMEFFEKDVEAAYFDSPECLSSLISYYLANNHERERIRLAGYTKSKSKQYSYSNLCKRLIAEDESY